MAGDGPRTAIIHYWLVGMRGGEQVLERLCSLFPEVDIYTHVVDPASLSARLAKMPIRTTFINRLPFARRLYQKYLPLMPIALEQLDLSGYDLVISSESGPAKGVLVPPGTPHLCYCHSPMRYLWDMYHEYRAAAGPLTRFLMPLLTHRLRQWDRLSADRVDRFVANSRFVAQRISKYYRRTSTVINPPVDPAAFAAPVQPDDYYLYVGQLTRYKRPDIAVDACTRLGRHLVVIGDGEMRAELTRRAGPTVRILGPCPREQVLEHFRKCRALLFPGVEDFGLVPVEAMASGRPVLAFGQGGALETVIHGSTGLHFDRQSVDGMADCIQEFERVETGFEADAAVSRAREFSVASFEEKMIGEIRRMMPSFAPPTPRGGAGDDP